MVRFLQKRKFRLVTRWKQALRHPGDLHRPEANPVKNTLIFRAFDDVMRELKNPAGSWPFDSTPGYAQFLSSEGVELSDQFLGLFLAGRTILGEFISHDPAFCAQFDKAARMELQTACDRVLMQFIDRELSVQVSRQETTNQHKAP